MANKGTVNWQLIAAAAAGVAAVGLGLYLLLRTPDETPKEVDDSSSSSSSASSTKESSNTSSSAAVTASNKATDSASSGSSMGTGEISKSNLKIILTTMVEKLEKLKETTDKKREALLRIGKDEQTVEESIQMEIQEGLQTIELKLQEQYGIDQFRLMEAQNKYQDDPEIAELMNKLRLQFFGENQMEELRNMESHVPSDMTADKFLGLMKKHMGILEKHYEEAINDTREQTPKATYEERVQYLEYLMQQRLDRIHTSALSVVGLDDNEFNGCMVKYGNDRRIVELVMQSQANQEQLKDARLRK